MQLMTSTNLSILIAIAASRTLNILVFCIVLNRQIRCYSDVHKKLYGEFQITMAHGQFFSNKTLLLKLHITWIFTDMQNHRKLTTRNIILILKIYVCWKQNYDIMSSSSFNFSDNILKCSLCTIVLLALPACDVT